MSTRHRWSLGHWPIRAWPTTQVHYYIDTQLLQICGKDINVKCNWTHFILLKINKNLEHWCCVSLNAVVIRASEDDRQRRATKTCNAYIMWHWMCIHFGCSLHWRGYIISLLSFVWSIYQYIAGWFHWPHYRWSYSTGQWWTLMWRHNGRDGVPNHQPHDCLLKRLFWRRSKKTSKLRVTGLCAGNSPMTGEFHAQMASNAENVSIWWRHHVIGLYLTVTLQGPISLTWVDFNPSMDK